MTQSLMRMARLALLLGAGFALATVATAIATATGGKDGLWQALGISSAQTSPFLAEASCDLPSKTNNDEIYFVSCGGFFNTAFARRRGRSIMA